MGGGVDSKKLLFLTFLKMYLTGVSQFKQLEIVIQLSLLTVLCILMLKVKWLYSTLLNYEPHSKIF